MGKRSEGSRRRSREARVERSRAGRGCGVEGGGRGSRELEEGLESRVEGRGLWKKKESSDEGPESRAVEEEVERPESSGRGLAEGVELRVEGVLGAGRLSLDARDHLALRSQGLGEASCAAEGF